MTERTLLGTRYEVLREVSKGHRASVLHALDCLHNRAVALKVYGVTGEDRETLLAEARVLMALAPHPSLPAVRGDFFTDDGHSYVIVMNWIDGRNLQEILDEEGAPGLPLENVIADLGQVAAALDQLHSHEPPVVHGDVKPANLVRATTGRIVLVDFDVAGGQGNRGPSGTLGYIAPEVAAGEKPEPAADVFGLAATAVTLLNGRSVAEAFPTFPGLDYLEQSHLARVLRNAMSTDPAKRPVSAGVLIEQLRSVTRIEQPSGVVAFLALEVADASRIWDDEPEEMRSAMARLGDVRDEVVHARQGRVVSSMNEGDRSISVFSETAAAALAALDLHDRVKVEAFPPGLVIRLRAAVAVGEVPLVDGVYTGALIDRLLRLRSMAEAGMTVTSESTAEQLVGLVGRELSIVLLRPGSSALPGGVALFALTRPGAESSARPPSASVAVDDATPVADDGVAAGKRHRGAIALAALEHPVTLGALLVVGLAMIWWLILTPVIDSGPMASYVATAAGFALVGSFGWQYIRGSQRQLAEIALVSRAQLAEEQERMVARERAELRLRLERGFDAVDSSSGLEGIQALGALAEEFDAVEAMGDRSGERSSTLIPAVLPHLAEEAYRNGMSALSDALELLESAEGASRRRLESELADIEDRLESDAYPDVRSRGRDERRLAAHRQLLARHDDSRQRSLELMFEAERCTAALAETRRLELASIRAGDTQVDVDAVIETLQHTIRRVREVQDEFRKLGY